MDTAEPSIDAVPSDVVRSTFDDASSFFGHRHVTQSVLRPVGNLNKRMPSFGQIGHHPIKGGVAHEDVLLHVLYGDVERWSTQLTMVAKHQESLPFRAG